MMINEKNWIECDSVTDLKKRQTPFLSVGDLFQIKQNLIIEVPEKGDGSRKFVGLELENKDSVGVVVSIAHNKDIDRFRMKFFIEGSIQTAHLGDDPEILKYHIFKKLIHRL